ncbi:MAG: AI-2E family transporter [Eubacteriaceae bacterium]|nr:AI-2E family transporter [Eubacteriaceae bacterium]
MNISKKQYALILDILFLAIAAIALFLIRNNIMNIITPFLMALVVAYLLHPLVNLLEKKGMKRIFAILLVFLIILLVIIVIFMTFIPGLVNDISALIQDIPNIFDNVMVFIEDLKSGDITFIPDSLYDFLNIENELNKLSDLLKTLLSSFSSALLASTVQLLNIIMAPILAFYYLKDKDLFIKSFLSPFNDHQKVKIKEAARDVDAVFGGFIRGQLIVATFVGVMTGVGCKLIGLPYALVIGLVAGVTNIIPFFGPWLGGIMPVTLAVMDEPITIFWTVVVIFIVQQIESNFLSPNIMARSVGLHPLTVIFSILLFGNVFGIPGMILGVPITGTLKVLVKYIMEFRESIKRPKIELEPEIESLTKIE